MSFSCEKCDQTFSTEKRLEKHKSNKIPCDFACQECEKKCSSRDQYNYHVKSRHQKTVVKQEVKAIEVQPLPPVRGMQLVHEEKRVTKTKNEQETMLIPIDDFLGKTRQDEIIKEIIKLANEGKLNNVVININNNITINVNDISTAQRAANMFRSYDLGTVMRCLENPDQTQQIAADILAQMHTDPERPEMHTVKMKDMSRKKISLYSRPSDDSPGKWLPYGYEAALRKLSEQAASLVRSALCSGINISSYKIRDDDNIMCLRLRTPIAKKYIVIYDDISDQELYDLNPFKPPISLKVELYTGTFSCIPQDDDEAQEERRVLDRHIKEKGELVLSQLKDIRFTAKDIGAFLERTQRPLTMRENLH